MLRVVMARFDEERSSRSLSHVDGVVIGGREQRFRRQM